MRRVSALCRAAVCAVVLLLSALPAFAAFPVPPGDWSTSACSPSVYPSNPYTNDPDITSTWGCKAATGATRTCGYFLNSAKYGWVDSFYGMCSQGKLPAACPANSTAVAGGCACAAGFVEVNGACKEPKSDKCGTLEGQALGVPINLSYGNRSVASMARMVGQQTNGCFPGGCTVSGTVQGCWGASTGGVSGCKITDPKFTGAACDENEDPDNGCPAGTTPSAYAAGVCIPDKNDCPAGTSPSKYASGVCIPDENPCPAGQSPSKYAQGVCLPKDDPNADGNDEEGGPNKCPSGYVPSKYVKDLCIPADKTAGRDGNTTCVDNVCTTKKPDGTTEEKPKDQFCADNPDSPLCVKGEFGGTCGAGFTCKGDAIQCAMAKEQHQQNCKLFGEDKDSNSLTNKALNGTDEKSADKLRENASQVSVGTFDSSGYGWSHACPADPSIALNFGGRQSEFSIPFSRICGPLSILSVAGVGITLLGCLVWVLGGKNNRG